MDGIRKLLTESMSTVQKNSAPTEDEYGSAEDSGSQGQGLERAQESHQLIEELARYIEWNLERLARPSQDGEPSTLEEIQADMGILLNDLDMHALLALRAICGYRMTLERIQANRQAYARYRNTESTVFDCEHSRLKIQQTERLTLLARLKLLHMKYDQGGKKHLLSDEEIKLLVTYKEELSPDEQTAVAKLQPGFLSRIKNFMS
jgi:hypothetical protein